MNRLSKNYSFHNLRHTCEVVEASSIIANYCELDSVDKELVVISCWFHDTGFSISPFNHFLSQHRYQTAVGKKILAERKLAHLNQNIQRLESLKTS